MSLRRLAPLAAVVPWVRKRAYGQNIDADASRADREGDNDLGSRPLLNNPAPSEQANDHSYYGSVDIAGPSSGIGSSRRSSPEYRRHDSNLDRVPEELGMEESENVDRAEEVEWDLEDRGLYPEIFWPLRHPTPRRHPLLYPFPLPEVLLSAALWAMAYLLRLPLYSGVSCLMGTINPFFTTMAFNALHAIAFNLLRITSLPILDVREKMQLPRPTWHDPIFRTVWWLSLGWALIDVLVGIAQSYSQLALYRSVMVPEDRIAAVLATSSADESRTDLLSSSQEILPLSPRHEVPGIGMPAGENGKAGRSTSGYARSLDEAIRLAVDQDLEQLVNLKEREDLEEIYGFPVIVSSLPDSDPIILLRRAPGMLPIENSRNTLVLSAAYLNSSLSLAVDTSFKSPTNNRPFLIAFPIIVLMNLTTSLLHTPQILPRIGVHTIAYIGFLLGLGSFFAGLGLWGALA
ncbi:hypothetical protein EIP86_006249 [Pleurotus ostreatoroseus]|nr:hypothetical protein EIP86_006249 [Pleurotus ostreatoroseus]